MKMHEFFKEISPVKKKVEYKTLSFWFWLLLFSLLTALFFYYLNYRQDTEQSIKYFPEDSQVRFIEKATTLRIKSGETEPKLVWDVTSSTQQPTYLRQDVSLLFEDGKLMDIYSKWKENEAKLSHNQNFSITKSSHFEAISIHHAESHYSADSIKGKDRLTYDHLYVMKNAQNQLESFQIPVATEEKKWVQSLGKATQQEQHYILEQAMKKYRLDINNYYSFPLTYLHVFDQNALPQLDMKTTHRVISQLWEGVYNGYVQGIKLTSSQIENPIGSAMPLVLFSKKADECLIIIKSASGQLTMLKQLI